MNKALKIQTHQLQLEPIKKEHSQVLFLFLQDDELHRYIPFEKPTLEQTEERISRWQKAQSPDGSEIWLNWLAFDKASGKIVGHFQAGIKTSVATIGYVVSREFQGQGLAFEAVTAVFEVLKNQFCVIAVKAFSDTRNLASHKLALKLGMKQIDYIKNADFFKGENSDEFVFSTQLK